MAELACSREVLAKRSGDCPMCPKPIVKDEDYVAKVNGSDKGWMHATCAHSYIRHREELEKLNRQLDETGSSAGGGDDER